MRTPGLDVTSMLRRVRSDVEATARKVNHEQRPSLRDETSGDFYFYPPAAGARPAQIDGDQVACDVARGTGSAAAWQAYLQEFPNGRCAAAARVAVTTLARSYAPSATSEVIDGRYQVLADGSEIKDLRTNLTWQRCSVGQRWDGTTCVGEAIDFTFDNAQRLAANDWRIPTIRELSSLIRCLPGGMRDRDDPNDGGGLIPNVCGGAHTKPTIQVDAFPNTPIFNYWSSSQHAKDPRYAWGVSFYSGAASNSYLQSVTTGKVRLVRGGE